MRRRRGRKEPITVRGSGAADVQEDDDPRLVHRREHDLADGEAGVRVGEDRGLGPHGHRDRGVDALELQRVALELERELEVVQELERPGPGLAGPVLVAEERRPAAHHVEEGAGPGRALQLQAAARELEAGYARRPGRGSVRGRRRRPRTAGQRRGRPAPGRAGRTAVERMMAEIRFFASAESRGLAAARTIPRSGGVRVTRA